MSAPREPRSTAERIADVRRLLDGARAMRSAPTLEAELVRTTGLSPAGVRLGLDQHLEVDASDADITRLITAAGDAESVAVVLSANVFVGALRAIAIARAASNHVVVRPSSREPSFAKALIAVVNDPAVALRETLDLATLSGQVHVYGRDETIAAVRAEARGATVVGHGAGLGIAFVEGDTIEAAHAIARDVVPFDQRGCLSPRFVLLRGDMAEANAFALALSTELARWEERVPRGQLSEDERVDVSRYRGTVAFAGELFDGRAHAVGCCQDLIMPPTGRHVHVVPCADDEAAARIVEPIKRYVAALGQNARAPALEALVPWARCTALGFMQRPPLDGPVDLQSFGTAAN